MAFLQKTFRNTVLLLTPFFVFAFAPNVQAQCELFMELEQSDCGELGVFDFILTVVPTNPGDAGFTVSENDEVIAVFDYNADGTSLYTLSTISSGVAETRTLSIADVENSDCQTTATLEVEACSLCEISTALITECNGDGGYYIEISTAHANSTIGQFMVSALSEPGVEWGPFNYGEETHIVGPITVSEDNNNWIYVNDANPEIEGCFDSKNFVWVDCENLCGLDLTESYVQGSSALNCEEFGVLAFFDNSTTYHYFGIFLNGEYQYSGQVGDVTFGMFPADGENPDTLTFVSESVINCETSLIIQPNEYCPATECILTSSVQGISDCDDNGNYSVFITVEAENPNGATFTVSDFNQVLETYEYGETIYEVGPFTSNPGEIIQLFIQDFENEACNVGLDIISPDCASSVCELSISNIETTECTSGGDFSIIFDLEAENPNGDNFTIFVNGTAVGNFPYGESPYNIGPFYNAFEEDIYTLFVVDQGAGNCNLTYDLASPGCPQCVAELTSATVSDCNSDGQFNIDFEVETAGPISDNFMIFVDGYGEYGPFTYGQPSYTVGLFQAGVQGGGFILINDGTDGANGCQINEILLDYPTCENTCLLEATNFIPINCTSDEVYFNASIYSENAGSEGFTVFLNGVNYGNFEHGQPTYDLGPFPFLASGSYDFIFIDNEEQTCTANYSYPAFPANECSNACFIATSNLEVTDCNSEGQFFINAQVSISPNSPSTSFMATIESTGEEFGPFDYGQDSYSFGPLTADGTFNDIFLVYDADDNPFCNGNQVTFFDPICENEPECQINIPFVEVGECNADGQFFVEFEMLPIDGDGTVEITGNGQNYGIYDYNLPIYTVGPFDGAEVGNYELIVTDTENPDCVEVLTFASANCDVEDCNISLTFDEYANCFGDNQFFVIVSVTNNDNPDGSFTFSFNEDMTIEEEYGAGSYAVGPFMGGGDLTHNIVVTDNQTADCSTSLLIDGQQCNFPPECELAITFTENYECDDQGEFQADFGVTGLSEGDEFYGQITGQTPVLYIFGEDFYTIGFVPGDGTNQGLTVYVEDQLECNDAVELDAQDCSDTPTCSMEVTALELTDCDDEGNFYVNFSLSATNSAGDTFFAAYNGTIYGPFEYLQTSYQIGPFDGSETAIFEIIIYDTANEECNTFIAFDWEACEGNEGCSLEITEVELTECNDENEFFVNFAVIANNPNAATFVVTGNGENYGTFEYGQDIYTVGQFDGNLDPVWELIVTDTENSECSTFITFVSPDCDNVECELDNFGAIELSSCDDEGQFYVDILPLGGNGETGSFTVIGNGENYGTFEYGEDFYTVGPFNGDGESIYELIATDDANEDCTLVLGFDALDCEDASVCNLEVAEYFATECNDEGQYFVNIYLTEGSYGSTFQVFTGAASYGPFDYGQDEYTVGPFDSGIDDFNLELYDTGFDQCFDNIDIDAVDCPVSDCFIENLEVATGECNDQGSYFIILDFEYNDVGGEFFNLFYQDEIIGTYETANLPITIENFAGNAEVETLTVCMDDLEECCASIDFLTPQCEGLVTWPGDANFDGITNNMDILNMGIAYGFEGPERATDNISWDAQSVLAWQENFVSGANYVHADADGSGEVDMADSEVVDINYDLTHDEVTPFEEVEGNEFSPALFVDMPDAFELQQGMEFSAPVIFGLEDIPVDDVYGLAFTLRYDPEIIDPTSITLQYPISWMGFPQTNLMTFDYHDTELGEIDVAITKIDQNNVSGWGEILSFIGIIDNIAGKTEIYIEVDYVKAILSDEARFPVHTPLEITTITSTKDVNELQGFDLFPNPTNDVVYIKNETGLSLQSIEITDLNGKVLQSEKGENAFDLSGLPSGVYMAKVVFEGKTVYRKVVRM